MSSRLGQTLAGLLNASFGNAVEIIVGVAALLRGAFYTRRSFTARLFTLFQMNSALCKLL